MVVHARAEEILAGAYPHYAVVIGWFNCVDRRVCCGPFYLYAVLTTATLITWVSLSREAVLKEHRVLLQFL